MTARTVMLEWVGVGHAENIVPKEKWYQDGLNFTCTQCGNCCTGSPGYVWTTAEERQAMADHLELDLADFTQRYARRVGFKYSLKEHGSRQNWDCVFLAHENGRRICRVYPVRPTQCRNWPFWDENLRTASAWSAAAEDCPGMNDGQRHGFVQIEIQRKRKF
ncbi:MAG: YkgJ family cysteine cluster protein [Planctomycetes bacterium]|nr:YkgJ family cysteine cluster protein [Planctomycetota bacterium]